MAGNKYWLGRRHSEETKAKMSKSQIGHIVTEEARVKLRQSHLGTHHTLEAKARMSKAQKGRVHSEETKAKMSKTGMCKIFTKEHRDNIRKAQLGNKYSLGRCYTEETKAKISKTKMGSVHSEEAKAKMSKASMGMVHSEETKAKMSNAQKQRFALTGGTWFGHRHSEETKAKMKEVWQDPEYRDRMIKAQRLGCHIHPNKSEALLFELLERMYPCEWKFVGDGALVIAGKNPDFANINGRKALIELYGNYWHEGEDPQDRIDLFKGYGFKTLVIWESELECPEKVIRRIIKFNNEKP